MNLAYFQRPSRYLSNEVNIIRKDAEVKFALCFPDVYEIGMSHLGLKILYSIINDIPYASAERVFAPWFDYEEFLRQKALPLTSLEGRRPLKDFDIVGFSLQYELSYTNVLNMLELGGIPVRSEDRGDDQPLVIAGGPCATNPLPLTPFIDAFVIGDGEEVIGEIIDVYKNFKVQNASRISRHKLQNERFNLKEDLLKALSELEGVYVPSCCLNGKRTKRRIIENLDDAPFPSAPVVPFASIVHDRVAIEVSRGCTRGCRFCQAGMLYRPLRERSPEHVLSLAQKAISNTGYEEVSFTSLSTGDYSCLLPLLRAFNKKFSNIAVSLPSLRVESVSRDLLNEIKSVRKTGFTIAPEAGTKRLRDIINKNLRDEDYENALEGLFRAGWRTLKLYFMIGLPTETAEDIDGIIELVEIARRKGRELTGGNVNINVGVSAFVPKPHTPFQWLGMMPFEELRQRQGYLRQRLQGRGFKFKSQHLEMSLLEAVLSRGDRKIASLIEGAWRGGSRFDGWSETFNFALWQDAAEKANIDLMSYASRRWDVNEELPWEIIDTGVTKEFLIDEFQNAFKGQITEDCRRICHDCGLGCKTVVSPQSSVVSEVLNVTPDGLIESSQLSTLRMRVTFSKTGTLRHLSHLEVTRALLRAMRRAEIPLVYTEGFHPHPKVSFGPALPVGVEGLNEYFDMEIYGDIDVFEIPAKMNATLPEGLRIIGISEAYRKKSLNESLFRYEYEIEGPQKVVRLFGAQLTSFMQRHQYIILRDGKTVDIREMIEEAKVNDGIVHLTLRDTHKGRVRFYEILKEIFQLSANELYELKIKRTRIHTIIRNQG